MGPTEPSWEQPGAHFVDTGVYRIPLPLPNDGLRAVNVYALVDGDGVTLVDGGWALLVGETALAAGLAQLGRGLSDIKRILVTHVHRDHYTLAVRLRRRFGMPISLGTGEQPNLDAMMLAARGIGDVSQRAQLTRAGAGELLTRLDRDTTGEIDMTDWEMPDQYLSDADVLTVGSRTLAVIATPGHTRGHVVFRDESAGLLFAGDHVLPRITPSLGFEAAPTPGALSRYIASLKTLLERPDTRLLPAHGHVAISVHHRVDELLLHHERRLTATLARVGKGSSTAYQVADRLGWTRHERPFAAMDLFNQCLAVTETTAHLEVLALRGVLVATTVDGDVDCYQPA